MALVAPVFFMVLFGILILGQGFFLQQQVTNAAREAARYASLHSATSQCPTVSTLDPPAALLAVPNSYYRCDAPENGWPEMRAALGQRVFGMDPARIGLTACWSGYWTKDTSGAWAAYDQIARDPVTGTANEFRQCTIQVQGTCPGTTTSAIHAIDPTTGDDQSCPDPTNKRLNVDCGTSFPPTSTANDMASDFAASNSANANRVTAFVCYRWEPPLSGFLFIPDAIDVTASVTEAMEYQQ